MSAIQGKTKAVNLRIEEQFEGLLRESVNGIRKGGPEFRRSLQELLNSLKADGSAVDQDLRERLSALEARVQHLEQRSVTRRKGF